MAALCLLLLAPPAAYAAPPAGSSGSIIPNASVAVTGQTVTFTVTASVINAPPPITTVDFGDGNSVVVNPPYPAFVPHVYTVPGSYVVILRLGVGNNSVITTTNVTILNPATFSLTASPTTVIAGQVVNFTAITGAPLPGTFVDFGDGSIGQAPAAVNHLTHRYSIPALYTARLLIPGQFASFAQVQVNVLPNAVRVPLGQIYSTFLVGSPVFAGADTSISLTYRIITPFVVSPGGFTPLQAIVELTDSHGRVIQRSDPFAIAIAQANINNVQTAMIPYTVPADASGDYLIRVYVRANQGGTVAIGRPMPLQIIGGADPAPIVTNAFHANGAILTNSGANRGGYQVNLGLTTALQWATEELLLTGAFDPVSKRIDPLATLQSATPAPITAPSATSAPGSTSTQVDSGTVTPPPTNTGTPTPGASEEPKVTATPTPAPVSSGAPPKATPAPSATPHKSSMIEQVVALAEGTAIADATSPTPQPVPAPPPPTLPQPRFQFKDVLGRTDSAMPSIVGSKQTIRGLDATYAFLSGVTFHAGAGFLQLSGAGTTERSGELIDITKAWAGGSDSFRVAYSSNYDNVKKFVPTGTAGPLGVNAGAFEFTDVLTPHLRALLTGGRSYQHQLMGGGPTLDDTAAKADLTYNVGTTTLDVEYHNAGPTFGTLSGASALTDRAGGTGALSFSMSPISTVSLNYVRDAVRSAFSQTTSANATLNLTPQNAPGITFALQRDTAAAPGSMVTTRTLNLGVSRTGASSLTLGATLAAAADALAPDSFSTTRTGVLTYQFTKGPHTFGAGLNATSTTSANSTASVTETINYGFTFGGRVPANTTGQPLSAGTRNFEAKLGLANVNMQAPTAGSHVATFTGLLQWHLTPQLAPGVEGNYVKHYDRDPAMNTSTSFLRFRLDVNI